MDVFAIFRAAMSRSLLGLIVMQFLFAAPVFPADSLDTQQIISGFNAYQNKDYQSAINKMMLVLQKNPDSQLRDVAIFWLARAHFKAGHRTEAAKYMAQFIREFPDSPLRGTIEPDLAMLAAAYEKGGTLAAAGVKEGAGEAKTAAEKLAADKVAAEKTAAEKLAADKAVAEKAAAEKLAADKAVAEKAAVEKLAADKAVAEKTAVEKLTAEMAAPKKVAQVKRKVKKNTGRKSTAVSALKEKAIAGYKAVIDRYPGSRAMAAASARLKELGVIYPAPVGAQVAALGENAKVLTLEVGQFADFTFTLAPAGQSYAAGKRFVLPFEVVNQGNGPDRFILESGFPSEFNVRFAAAAAPDSSITVTPLLAPGEKFAGILTAVVPRASIDGQKSVFPIKIGSQFARDVSQSREIALVASAPLLRAVIKPDKVAVLPGEKVAYRIALLNVGSNDASGVTLRLSYPPQYEPADFIPAGFRQEMKGTLVLDGLRIKSGESREVTVAFQVREEALARQELFLRGDAINGELESRDSFLSPATVVQGVSGVAARTNTEKLIVIPGQTVTIPIVVTNTGNMREAFQIRPGIPAGLVCRFFQDLKRDGIRQPNQQPITLLGPLAPREEAYLLMELATPPSAADGADVAVSTLLVPENDTGKNAAVTVKLRFARAIIELAMTGKGGKLKPGDVSTYELNVVNRGSNLAKVVELQSILPDNLVMVVAEPSSRQSGNGVYVWKFAELGAGETRNIKITFRVKAGIPVGTNIQIKNLVTYEDQLGNRY